jgi:hypothetical protein
MLLSLVVRSSPVAVYVVFTALLTRGRRDELTQSKVRLLSADRRTWLQEGKKSRCTYILRTAKQMPISDYVTLWRYVDLYRLLDMLQHRRLPFIRLDKMSDPYEAYGSQNTISSLKRRIEIGHEVAISQSSLALFETPQRFLVNSWHENVYESDAMWKLYASQGIAIKTTEARLLKSLSVTNTPREQHVPFQCTTNQGILTKQLCFDKVRYDDEGATNIRVYGKYHCVPPYITKRISFKHEQEYRVVIDWDTKGPERHYLPVDLDELVHEIIIHPLMQEWEVQVIKTALEPTGLQDRAKQSTLYKKP